MDDSTDRPEEPTTAVQEGSVAAGAQPFADERRGGPAQRHERADGLRYYVAAVLALVVIAALVVLAGR